MFGLEIFELLDSHFCPLVGALVDDCIASFACHILSHQLGVVDLLGTQVSHTDIREGGGGEYLILRWDS